MNKIYSISTSLLLTLCIPFLLGNDWPQFRGPGGTSAVSDSTIPVEFDDQKNIGWKTDLPAKGASSPIVVGKKVFVRRSFGI